MLAANPVSPIPCETGGAGVSAAAVAAALAGRQFRVGIGFSAAIAAFHCAMIFSSTSANNAVERLIGLRYLNEPPDKLAVARVVHRDDRHAHVRNASRWLCILL